MILQKVIIHPSGFVVPLWYTLRVTTPREIRRTYKLKLRPSAATVTTFLSTLDVCRELYNATIQERKEAYRHKLACKEVGCKWCVPVSFYSQQAQLPEIRKERPDCATLHSVLLKDVLFRVDRAFKAFFRRVKAGKTPGYPRFRSRCRYDSFSYLSDGFKLDGNRLHLSKIGWIRFWEHGKLDASRVQVKTVTIRREADAWYAVLSCVEVTPARLPETGRAVGLDMGLHALIATSEGVVLPVPAALREAQKRLSRQQRALSRKRNKRSNRRRKAVNDLARAHKNLRETRALELHRITKNLVETFDLIAIEKLNVEAMGRMGGHNARGRGFRRSMRNAAWGTLRQQLVYKAEWAGRQVVEVDPRNTSQECSGCGRLVPKTLRERTHRCPHCGLVLHRDVNAGKVVLKRALAGPSPRAGPVRTPVEASRLVH